MTPTLLVSAFVVTLLGQTAFVQVQIKFHFYFASEWEKILKGYFLSFSRSPKNVSFLLCRNIGADDSPLWNEKKHKKSKART